MCGPNCLAYHDDRALNVLTKQRPPLVTPPFGHNSFSRVMCVIQCYSILAFNLGEPSAEFRALFDKWGLNVTGLDPAVAVAVENRNFFELFQIVQDNDYHPLFVGQLVALEIGAATVLDNKDGWNRFGEMTYDAETDSIVKCTANCMPFADTTGYHPRNQPRVPTPGEDKYAVNGTDMYWQPLLEDDGAGYFSRQEHVVPHIGLTAKP